MKGFRRMPMMILTKEAGIIVKFARVKTINMMDG